MNPLEQFSPVPFFVFQLNNTFFNLTSVSVMFFFIFFVLSIFITGPMFKTNNLFFFKLKNIQPFNKNILNLNNKLKLKLGLAIENNIVLENNLDFDTVRKIMTDSYSRGEGLPNAGFAAGPCLLKDTMQLYAFSKNIFSIGNPTYNGSLNNWYHKCQKLSFFKMVLTIFLLYL